MPPSRALPLVLLAASALAARPAAAQTVTGSLLEPGGRPVEQVLVALVDADGRQRAATLTDTAGAFSIRAPAAGRWSLRAERIGYATVTSAPFDLRDGETRTERLTASGSAVALQGLRVSAGGRRCSGRTERAAETATLWEEARKALNATAFAERERLYRYDVVRWTRDLDPRTGAVTRESRQASGRVTEHPFVSAPPEELSREGFIRRAQGDSTIYWGPDAEVMLSDEFMSDHCFRVVTGADAEQVGLAFEPVPGRAVPDLAGTLWLDRGTAELRRVEYRYVGGPPESESPRVGGAVEYARLPGGPWIVRRWAIRMPLVQEVRAGTLGSMEVSRDGGPPMRVVAVRESGGEVTGTSAGGGFAGADAGPVVEGMVWDSTRGAPVAGARVYLSGTLAETVSGPDGRYRLHGPAEGTYLLAFTHPELGPLAAAAPPRPVALKAGAPATADLAVPGWPAVAAALCPDSTLRLNRGILVGSVRGYAGDTALVSAVWTRTVVGGNAATRSNTQFLATRPDAQGFYVLCGLPEGHPLQVGMRRGSLDEGGTAVTLRAGVPLRQDISAAQRIVHGEVDLTDVKAVAAAAGVPIRTAETPAGRGALAGFERRRQSGRGIFLARADVERRHAARLVDLFRGLAGVQVVRDPAGERVVMTGARGGRWSDDMRPAASDSTAGAPGRAGAQRTPPPGAAEPDPNACAVQYFVDGVPTPTDGGRLSNEVEPADVEAVEVYRTAAEVPAEYRRSGSTCGAIVIWTRHFAQTH